MKKTLAITSLVIGLLLFLVPRYVLPACEFEGFPAMHCSDTARAEFIVGMLLVALGIAAFFLKSLRAVAASAALGLVLSIMAFALPDIFGYCHSSRMPCNYGMVPGLRFIGLVSGLIMIAVLTGTIRSLTKKGSA